MVGLRFHLNSCAPAYHGRSLWIFQGKKSERGKTTGRGPKAHCLRHFAANSTVCRSGGLASALPGFNHFLVDLASGVVPDSVVGASGGFESSLALL